MGGEVRGEKEGWGELRGREMERGKKGRKRGRERKEDVIGKEK